MNHTRNIIFYIVATFFSSCFLFPESGDDLFKFGMNLYQNGKYVSSVKVFSNFVNKYSDSEFTEEASYFLGSSYYEIQEYKEAERILEELFYSGRKVYLKEETLYKVIMSLASLNDPVSLKEKADIFRKKFPGSSYLTNINRLLQPEPQEPLNDKVENGGESFEQLARKIMEKENISLDSAYYFLGLDLQQNDASSKAEILYREFLKLFPKSNWFYNAKYMLALILIQKNESGAAISELKTVYLNSPDVELKINSLYLLAEIHISSGKFDEAKKYYRMISEDYKDSPLAEDAYYMLGEILSKQGMEKESAGVFSKIVDLRSAVREKKTEVEKAEVISEKLPKDVTEKIKKLMNDKNYAQAIKEIEFSIQTYGLKPEFFYLRGNIYQLMSRYKEAIQEYEKYMKETHDTSVYSILGYLYYVIGDYNSSIEFYKKIISEVKDSKRIRDAKYAIEKIKKKI